MQTVKYAFSRGVWEPGATATALILYDDPRALAAANRLVDRALSSAGQSKRWLVNSWRLGMLMLGRSLDAYHALEEAMDAELILIALRDPRTWTDQQTEWLATWVPHRRRPESRLVVLPLNGAREHSAAAVVIDTLRALAEFRDMPLAVVGSESPVTGERSDRGAPASARDPSFEGTDPSGVSAWRRNALRN